jgi:Fe-S-cluster containining protein
MSAEPQAAEQTVTANVELGNPLWKVQLKVTAPAGPTRLIRLLPLANQLADALVGVAANAVEELGEKISCKAGCGACCRQLVPISEVEARRIAEVVEALPEPRRTQVRERFAEARRRLAESGLLEKLEQRTAWDQEEYRAVGLAYFHQGVACPFLEDESCSVYEDRPVTCREYLVTSPAEFCAKPSADTVRCVQLPMRVLPGLTGFDPVPAGAVYVRWVPLILAPGWAEAHPDPSPERPGPEWLRELFAHLAQKELAKAQAPTMGGPAPADGGT